MMYKNYTYRLKSIIFSSIFVILILTMPLILNVYATPSIYQDEHVQFSIWNYENIHTQPPNALVLEMAHEQWQATAAAAITPAFINRFDATPLFFDDGSELSTIAIPHDTKKVTEFGADATLATGNIATSYWSKAEIVVITDNYEHTLWAVPIAAFLTAPILIEPPHDILRSLNTKSAIMIGEGSPPDLDEIIEIETLEEVWQFQLELFDTKGQICNYIIVTNPHDTDDELDPNIKWPYMSLASAPLAAYRNAMMQTGDYTGDRILLDKIHKSSSRDDALYQQVKPYFEKVKADSYNIEKYLIDKGHAPEFITLVCGAFALPDYYYDIHVKYKYWSQEVHYVPSAGPYGNLTPLMPTNESVREDLGVGRILAHSILDATNQLIRTFFYQDFLEGGKYSGLTSENWQDNAMILDGHRQNQPREGGIQTCSADECFPPSDEIIAAFENSDYNIEYYTPRNETDPTDTNPPAGMLMDSLQNASMIQFIAHGGSMGNPRQVWMEVGNDPVTGEEQKHYIYASDIMARSYAPSVVHFIACHTGHVFLDIDPLEMLPLAFIHSGAVAYIAPVTCQSICFWEGAPYGVAATQTELFWQKLGTQNIAIGQAFAEAKWEAYQEWYMPNDEREEPDGPTFHIFGDPAFEPYKPKVAFKTEKKLDISIESEAPRSKKGFDITITISDLETQQPITDTTITTTFNEKSVGGNNVQLTAPQAKGSYLMEITVSKAGYDDITAKYWVYVEKKTTEGVIPAFEAGILIFIGMLLVLAISKNHRRRPNRKN